MNIEQLNQELNQFFKRKQTGRFFEELKITNKDDCYKMVQFYNKLVKDGRGVLLNIYKRPFVSFDNRTILSNEICSRFNKKMLLGIHVFADKKNAPWS